MFACVIFTACICVTRKYVLRVIGVSAPSLHWQAVASQPSHSAGGGSLFLSIMVRSCRHLPGGGGGGGGAIARAPRANIKPAHLKVKGCSRHCH